MRRLLVQPGWVGVVVIVMAIVSMVSLLYYGYTDRKEAECQRRVNIIFLELQKDRGALFEEDRDAVYDLVDGLVNEDGEGDEKVINEYLTRQRTLDSLLKKYQYPDIEKTCQ